MLWKTKKEETRPLSARVTLPGEMAAHHIMLDEALGAWAHPPRANSLANAVAIWAVRRLGGAGASAFADAVVAGVQAERRRVNTGWTK